MGRVVEVGRVVGTLVVGTLVVGRIVVIDTGIS